jgi:histidyl-tRNA synthetase
MKVKVSVPKGTRDFTPEVMLKRKYIFDILEKNFRLFGYVPIETPALENPSTLLGKYGEEGDKLLFKILNSGLENKIENKELKDITNKGLRYDLTVPFARYVVQHRNEITFPFKRYQIQPVWRADKPQKGRYREFYQCDIDVIGSNSLLNEVELILIIHRVFNELGINITIKLNNRKILSGIAQKINAPDKLTDITIAIDKIEKIGLERVKNELAQRGLSENQIKELEPILTLQGSNIEKTAFLKTYLSGIEEGEKGLEELLFVMNSLKETFPEVYNTIEFDTSLARGLNYYTGAILEVKANDVQIGSICGGGRYDNLTGIFGLENVSGVGISFGADRIYDVMEQLDLFGNVANIPAKVLFVNFGDEYLPNIYRYAETLREQNISSIIYPDNVKLKKQFDYANKNRIPFVIILGENEIKNNTLSLKNMDTGEQKELTISEALEIIKTN